MAKRKSEIEDLLFTFGIDSEAGDLFQNYMDKIANGKLRTYQEIIQYGAKAGESLYLHILNGICVLEKVRPILNLDDIEVQVLFSAFSVHDLNKLEEFQETKRSFNYLANAENISGVLSDLEIEHFFPEWQDYLKDIEVLVRAHSRFHNTYGETLDQNYDPYSLDKDRLLNYLVPIIRAIDVIDLSKTLEERPKKRDFLFEINSICDIQYKFVYHKVSEQRGMLTNLIHNEIVKYLESEKDLLPMLYYPDGVAYLVDRDRNVRITTDEIAEIGSSVVHNIESKTRGEFIKFIQGSPAGIKVDEKCIALGVSFAKIWNEVRNIISERKYVANAKVDDLNTKCQERLEGIRNKLSRSDPNVIGQRALLDEILDAETYRLPPNDDAIRIGELVRTYYIFLNKHFSKTVVNAWLHIYELLELPLNSEDITYRERYEMFNALWDRGYIIGRDLYNAGRGFHEIYELIVQDGTQFLETLETESEFGILVDYVLKYVDFNFVADRERGFDTNLKRYVKDNHVQCSTCGSEFDTVLWMKPDVPANIKVQQFSNRLEGGSSREPKRRVCSVCRTQYMLDKLCYNVGGGTATFFIHLYPISFFTDVFIRAFQRAQQNFEHPDFPSVFLKTDDALRNYQERTQLELTFSRTKVNGNPLPRFSEALGNILTIPVNTPGNNHTENILFAIENALLYQRFLGCRAVLTDSSIPLFSGDEFSHLFVDHIPSAFQGWLPDNNLNSDITQQTFEQLLKLHTIRSKIGSIDADDLVRLIRSLNYDALELYYVTHRMIKREQAGNEPRQFVTVRDTAQLIADVVAQKGGDTIMSHIKELARIAWEGRLKGESLKDNSLAKPLDVAFDSLERWQSEHETEEEARAIMSKEVARAIERLNKQFFGVKKLENISQFVTVLFDHIYKGVYQGNLLNLLENRKRIRAGYLYFITEMIPKRERDKEEQQS
ncbi:MAG: type I-D CRISPR-associated protein Cas10d/Csc3 [Candidatus Poribacteria bacterium]|nr:type I-D CRISPR-associated protein Cas10d/Csc3 [Candidatus Poribacteria bacterium]